MEMYVECHGPCKKKIWIQHEPYHDGTIRMSSPKNHRDIWGGRDVLELGFHYFCEDCYNAWHEMMKRWLDGGEGSMVAKWT